MAKKLNDSIWEKQLEFFNKIIDKYSVQGNDSYEINGSLIGIIDIYKIFNNRKDKLLKAYLNTS